MNKSITGYIQKQIQFVLATTSGNKPWCAICFYAYDADTNTLVFVSDEKSKHIQDALQQPEVAGAISGKNKIITHLQGVQFTGIFKQPDGIQLQKAKTVYAQKFPLIKFSGKDYWIIELISVKMTDNTLGFGQKHIWRKEVF